MEWRDEAIILGVRPHGETSAIVELMTLAHGRHQGRVQGGRTRRWQPILQMGNRVEAHWWARLDEHLGRFRLEVRDFVAPLLMENPLQLYAMHTMSAHLRLLGERDPHPELYQGLNMVIEHGEDAFILAEILARFELQLLSSLGFGIDLSACAATGTCDDLTYVSPKSGRAVSRQAGYPWRDKLLSLPQFLLYAEERASTPQALGEAFALTSFFLGRHIWEPRTLEPPLMRARYFHHLNQTLEQLGPKV